MNSPNGEPARDTVQSITIDPMDRYRWRTGSPVHTITDVAVWYLSYCQGQRRSFNTIRSYRNALNSIGAILAEMTGHPADQLPVELLNRNDLGDAFNEYAATHAASSQRQCWTVWNGMCQLLVDHEVMGRNPMTHVVSGSNSGRTKVPKALPPEAVEALLSTLASPDAAETTKRRPDRRRWRERDHAIILLLLVTGMRESELCGLNLGDINSPFDNSGARTVLIRGKGDKERSMVIEAPVVQVIAEYLETRRVRLPNTAHRVDTVWHCWDNPEPLFVSAHGERFTASAVYYRVKAAYEAAGITGYRTSGALVHQLRHTFATMLANDPEVTTYQLKQLMGHSSLSSTERYTLGAGRATRTAGSRNPVYQMMSDD